MSGSRSKLPIAALAALLLATAGFFTYLLREVNLSGVYTDIEVQPRLFSRPVRLNTLGIGTRSSAAKADERRNRNLKTTQGYIWAKI